MPDVAKYLQRVSYILRQGTPANDVALFLPNSDAWTDLGRNFSMSTTLAGKVGGSVKAITDAGYDLDFFDDQLLAMRGKVSGDTLAFGDVHYRAVVLPGVERIPLATMQTLEKFAKRRRHRHRHATAAGFGAGLHGDRRGHAKPFATSSQRLFKDPNAPGIFIEDESQIGAALAKRLPPDVAISPAAPEIGEVHRHTADGEIYFIANTSNEPKSVDAAFRVEGLQPEIWNPMNGGVNPATVAGKIRRLDDRPFEPGALRFDDCRVHETQFARARKIQFGRAKCRRRLI